MKLHYYRQRNSDGQLATKFEGLVLSVVLDETLLTEDMICMLYSSARASKPYDYPEMTRLSIVEHIRLLQDKGFLKAFSGYELRNSLKLPR